MTRTTIGSLLLVILLMHLEGLLANIPFAMDHTLHCARDLLLFSSSVLIYLMFYGAFVLMDIPLVMAVKTSAKLPSFPRLSKWQCDM